MMPMRCGGLTDERAADETIQKLIEKLKSDVEARCVKTFNSYIAVSYKSQVVAGTNYFVKVDVGSDEFVHLRVFQPLPHTRASASLANLKVNMKDSDPIDCF